MREIWEREASETRVDEEVVVEVTEVLRYTAVAAAIGMMMWSSSQGERGVSPWRSRWRERKQARPRKGQYLLTGPTIYGNSASSHLTHRFNVLCFSAVSTIFRFTNSPFRSLTRSMYPFAMFSLSAFSPSSSSSSSVVGTQNGSSSNITYLPS